MHFHFFWGGSDVVLRVSYPGNNKGYILLYFIYISNVREPNHRKLPRADVLAQTFNLTHFLGLTCYTARGSLTSGMGKTSCLSLCTQTRGERRTIGLSPDHKASPWFYHINSGRMLERWIQSPNIGGRYITRRHSVLELAYDTMLLIIICCILLGKCA